MRFNQRAKFIEDFLDTFCRPVMETKGEEYSRGEADCNSNFKRVAEGVGSDPVTICYVYLAKHLDSIANFVKTGATKSEESIEGRIGDAVNYLLILASLIEEQKEANKPAGSVPHGTGTRKPFPPMGEVDVQHV